MVHIKIMMLQQLNKKKNVIKKWEFEKKVPKENGRRKLVSERLQSSTYLVVI